jgi:hypothetical protein
MTKDSVDSPIKPVGRRAIAYWFVITTTINNMKAFVNVPAHYLADNAIALVNIFGAGKAYANDLANIFGAGLAYPNKGIIATTINPTASSADYANAIDESVKPVNLFAQDRIVSKVNFSELIADLEALKPIIPDDKATRKEHQEFVDQLFKMWNTAFNLTPELLNLSLEETYEIDEHYFYINRLILDCQKVAVNISPTVWLEIEDRMLRVP